MACFKAWLGRMDWLAMEISFPIILLEFYFDWSEIHNSISMVIAPGNFYGETRFI